MRGGKSSVEWRGARFGIVALAARALTASVMEAQEVSRERNASTEEGAPPDVLVGMRGELVGLFSPGANLDVVVRSSVSRPGPPPSPYTTLPAATPAPDGSCSMTASPRFSSTGCRTGV